MKEYSEEKVNEAINDALKSMPPMEPLTYFV